MNYIHSKGGWKGEAPTWDTSEEVARVSYAEEISEEAAANMEKFSHEVTSMTLRELLPESPLATDHKRKSGRLRVRRRVASQ